MSRDGALRRVCPGCKWSSSAPGLKACGGCGSRKLRWRFELDVAPPGSPRKRITRTFATKEEASESLREHLDRLGKGGFTQGSASMTLTEWMAMWVEREERRVRAGTLKPRTLEGYASHLRLYVAGSEVGGTRLDRITRDALERLYDDLSSRGLSASTVHRVHATIRRSLSDAVERSILASNPATGAHKAPTSMKVKTRPWDQTEVGTFLASEVVRADRHYPALHLAAMSGVRRGELLALRWSDLDMETCRLAIRRGVVRTRNQGLVIGDPKTEAGKRTIVLDSQTVNVLRLHRQRQRIEHRWMTRDEVSDDGYMFPNTRGALIDPDTFTGHFVRLIKKADLRKTRLHDLRHAHASHLIAIGKSALFIQHRLGHSDITVTLGTYGHLFTEMEADDVEDAAEMIYKAIGGSR
jgi:integrase